MKKSKEIIETTDYSQLHLAQDGLNRFIPETKVAALIKEIKKINLLENNPILVNSDGLIIDGQTRYLAAKQLNLPIYYTVRDDVTIEQSASISRIQKSWTVIDFVSHYAAMGKEDYIFLKDKYIETGICLTTLASLFSIGTVLDNNITFSGFNLHSGYASLNIGFFSIKHKDFGNDILNMAKDFGNFNNFRFWKNRKFLTAFCSIVHTGLYEHDKMLSKLNTRPFALQNKATVKDFIEMISDIYNFNSKHKVNFPATVTIKVL